MTKHYLAGLVLAFFIAFINPVTVNAQDTTAESIEAVHNEVSFYQEEIQRQFEEQFQVQFMLQWQEQYMEQLQAQLNSEPEITVTDEEFNALCMVGMNEAGNQGTQGIRYVISCVLNRVEDPRFPNDILGVIYQPNQFSTHHKFVPTEEVREAVRMELKERSDSTIKWFCSTGYNYYGVPKFQHGGHWFSE